MLRNITLSADEGLIERARAKAVQEKTTLNRLFRDWLARYLRRGDAVEGYDQFMREAAPVYDAGRSFSRDELNER